MNNNCFDNKIKKILDCGKQCNCIPVIVGPTGPTGPTGPQGLQGIQQDRKALLVSL